MTHTCHAHGCTRSVPPKMFACLLHWRSLRTAMQRAIWREYKPGQENTKDPSPHYMAVQRLAVAEMVPLDSSHSAVERWRYRGEAESWRVRAIQSDGRDPLNGLVKNEPIFQQKDT